MSQCLQLSYPALFCTDVWRSQAVKGSKSEELGKRAGKRAGSRKELRDKKRREISWLVFVLPERLCEQQPSCIIYDVQTQQLCMKATVEKHKFTGRPTHTPYFISVSLQLCNTGNTIISKVRRQAQRSGATCLTLKSESCRVKMYTGACLIPWSESFRLYHPVPGRPWVRCWWWGEWVESTHLV